MRNALVLAFLLVLPSCAFFQRARDTFDGLVNPLVGLGMLLSVAPADSDEVDLSNGPVDEGTTFTLMLVDAAQVNDLDNAPVTGATVHLEGAQATEVQDGTYAIAPGSLTYDAGAVWEAQIERGRSFASASLTLPAESDYTPPTTHDAGSDLEVDLTGEDHHAVLIMVIDAAAGELTWSNEPETPREIYDFTRRSGELAVTIPGAEAFPEETLYLVGIAGMRHTGASDLESMNTVLSAIMSGQMVFHPVSTVPAL